MIQGLCNSTYGERQTAKIAFPIKAKAAWRQELGLQMDEGL